jgi:branched-chain amino acid transport system permease protein
MLEVDTILATFGMSFAFVGIMLLAFGGGYFTYSYLAEPFPIFGSPFGLNRVVASLIAAVICGLLYVWIHGTRTGMAIRAVAVDPAAAGLVAIDVPRMSALSFALGGAVTAAGGIVLSTFLTMDASVGVVFTMKALIIVIMGGVGDVRGTIIASLILGLAETAVATLVDPGMTLAAAYLLFVLVLLFRPQGLFGRRAS